MAGLDLSYGDVTGEYLALRQRAGVAAGLHEAVRITGSDSRSFLQGILTQDVETMADGEVRRGALLSPKGRVRALLWMVADAGDVVLVTDAGFGGVVADDLGRFRIRVQVDIDTPVALVDIWGPSSPEVAAALAGDERLVVQVPLEDLPRYFAAGTTMEEAILAGARPVGQLALDAVRIEGGEPILGRDVGRECLLHDTGLVQEAVSFTKGCYLGQEIVSRIEHRGRAVRTLRGLRVTTNVVPPTGAIVVHQGTDVGSVGTVAESLEQRAPVALAVIRTAVPVGDTVDLTWEGGSAPAVVVGLPMDDFTDL